MSIGENGIFTKAKQAEEQYEKATAKEKIELAILEIQTEKISNNGKCTIEDIIEELPNKMEGLTTTKIEQDTILTYGGLDFEINDNLQVTTSYARYDEPYIPTGFKYKEGSWNNGYTIIGDTQSTGNEFVWVPCVLDQSKVKEGDTVVTFKKILPTKLDETDPYFLYNKLGYKLLPIYSEVLEEDSSVKEIEESVKKYGGFYIAKYEAGVPYNSNGEKETTANYKLSTRIATDGTEKPVSQEGCGVWNCITRADAITVSKAMIDTSATGAKSTLISGEAWDTTLQWMVKASDNKNNEPNLNYDINAKNKAWYNQTSTHTTGYYPVNNIYDMAGNVEEMTTENCISGTIDYMVDRGNMFASNSPMVANRICKYETSKFDYIGFRVVMYK